MEGRRKEKAWGNWHNWFICPAAKDCQANRESKGSHGLKKPGILCNILGRLHRDFKTHNTYVFNPSFFQVRIYLFRCMALVPLTFWGNVMYLIYFVQRLKLKMFSWSAFCFWFLLFRHLGTNSLLAKVVERVRWSRTKSLLKKQQTNWHLSIFSIH